MFSRSRKNVIKVPTLRLHPKSLLTPAQTHKAAIAFCSVVILTAILWVRLPGQTVSLKVGDTAPEDIRTPRAVSVYAEAETRRRREEAASLVPPQYPDINPRVKATALERVQKTFQAVLKFRREHPSAAKRRRNLPKLQKQIADVQLPEATLLTCLSAEPADVAKLEQATRSIVTSIYNQQIRSGAGDLTFARQRIERKARETLFPAEFQEVILHVSRSVVNRPNSIYNEELTEEARRRARNAVKPVFHHVKPGEVIVQRGEQITLDAMEKLRALGLVRTRWDWASLLNALGLATFFVCVVGVYVYQHTPRIHREVRLLYLLALVPLTALLSYKGVSRFPGLEFYLPVQVTASVGMLIAILLDAQLAMVVALAVSILTTVMCRGDLPLCLMSLGSAMVGVYCVTHIASRKQLINTGFVLAGINVFLSAMSGALQGVPLREVLLNSAWGVGNGFASVMVAFSAVMFLERPFGITTHLRLLELSDPNEPILRQMQVEAPGTATHSVLVANIAESGAKAIGADALLCRVACLYHDIGKLRRPHCFTENQFGAENIHDRLNPSLSALAVIAHVKEGIEMAKQLKLPQPIVDIIPQHHGTSLVSFFYQRAVENQVNGDVPEESFRYPGPKPQTKEAAIVMLADSVEAAARTLSKPTPHRIEQLVRAIIRNRLEDGQLNECDLTLRDLERITQAFTHVLQGLLHSRVEYPESPWGENKNHVRASGSSGALPASAQRESATRGLRRIAGRRN